MYENELFNMNDEMFEINNKFETEEEKCCDAPNFQHINGYYTCVSCGTVDTRRNTFFQENIEQHTITRNQPYRRISYFYQKMDFLRGIRYPPDQNKFQECVNKLRATQFVQRSQEIFKGKTEQEIITLMISSQFIRGFRQVLTNLGCNVFYKYIYLVINVLFGVQCFKLSHNSISSLASQWQTLEIRFKEMNKNRKNIFNYNVALHCLFVKNNIENSELLLLPKNCLRIQTELNKIISA